MRNLEARLVDLNFVEKKNVQVEGPRSVGDACRAVAAKLQLDRQQLTEQLRWLQLGLQRDDSIHKSRLLCNSNRLGRVERGTRGHATEGFEA